jgi:hypothetical protein
MSKAPPLLLSRWDNEKLQQHADMHHRNLILILYA